MGTSRSMLRGYPGRHGAPDAECPLAANPHEQSVS